jgi:uncharacterized membrane protein
LKYVTTLFVLGVVVQFFLVGIGLFGMKHGANIDKAKSLDPHRALGFIISDGGGILMLILVLLAWPTSRRLLGMWIVLGVLALVQPVLASSGYNHQWVGMFHPVVAIILLGLSGRLASEAWRADKTKENAAAPATAPTG